jgi:CubicO group peptidase (beta-lactamase class C family)
MLPALATAQSKPVEPPQLHQARAHFEEALRQRATQLTIPGIAYVVVRDDDVLFRGQIVTGEGPALTPETPMRVASITKGFTAVLLMRAVEAGKLSLDDSVSKWLPELAANKQITVRHLAAHVSEGTPGEEYVYGTQRYTKLGRILAAVYGADSFETALRRELLDKAHIRWYDSPDLGAHAALVSTADDVALFVRALQRGSLLSEKSFKTMTTPFNNSAGVAQPVGVGFFSQQLAAEQVVWSFAQDDPDYGSGLVLMLPRRKLALVMLANTDELANPFRLLMGDVRTSPFAAAFLDAFAPDVASGITARDRRVSELLIAMARGEMEAVVSGLEKFASDFPVSEPHDFAPQFLAAVAGDKAPRAFAEQLDSKVLAAHPRNRWALLMSGGIRSALGQRALAVAAYQTLLGLQNQEPDGLAMLFRAWACLGLGNALKQQDPARAAQYVRDGLATGVQGGTRADLERLQQELQGAAKSP